MNQAMNWDFFIAHASADKVPAETLYQILVQRSRVFLDMKCLRLGDDWDARIAEAQRASFVTVVLLSNRTDAAYYQREEIAAAIALAREDASAHRVVPVFLSPEENLRVEIPYGLRLKHGICLGDQVDLEAAAQLLLDLLESVQDIEASAFLFANYVSQLTSPNLTDDDRQALVAEVRKLPGLPESWRAPITGFIPVSGIWDLVDRIAPDNRSRERKALLLGLHVCTFENLLRRRDSLMSKGAEQLRTALRDMDPPQHLADQVLARIDTALSDGTCNGVEEELVPLLVPWLRARGRGCPTMQ